MFPLVRGANGASGAPAATVPAISGSVVVVAHEASPSTAVVSNTDDVDGEVVRERCERASCNKISC